jgi:hypothetical protein
VLRQEGLSAGQNYGQMLNLWSSYRVIPTKVGISGDPVPAGMRLASPSLGDMQTSL